MKKMNIEAIETLGTDVAVCGSSKQQEVGGPICAGVAIGVMIYVAK